MNVYIYMISGPGMERKDLLNKNVNIFKAQGRLLNDVASKNVKVRQSQTCMALCPWYMIVLRACMHFYVWNVMLSKVCVHKTNGCTIYLLFYIVLIISLAAEGRGAA